jgi:hypothetical protein
MDANNAHTPDDEERRSRIITFGQIEEKAIAWVWLYQIGQHLIACDLPGRWCLLTNDAGGGEIVVYANHLGEMLKWKRALLALGGKFTDITDDVVSEIDEPVVACVWTWEGVTVNLNANLKRAAASGTSGVQPPAA